MTSESIECGDISLTRDFMFIEKIRSCTIIYINLSVKALLGYSWIFQLFIWDNLYFQTLENLLIIFYNINGI